MLEKVPYMLAKMFSSMFGRKKSIPIPLQLYGLVVAQSRNPVFFTQFSFKDTVMGRFDVLSLHMFLLSRRLVREDDDISLSLNQEIFDTFTGDLDSSLRELGVGDPSVPKRKKKMIRGFYGQIEDFANLMDDGDLKGLTAAVKTRFFPKGRAKDVKGLAQYMMSCGEYLDDQNVSEICKGKLDWPNTSVDLEN